MDNATEERPAIKPGTVVVERALPRRAATASRATQVTPMQMIALAVQQGASAEYIKQLMDLRDRNDATEARKAFDAAISAAKAEIKPVIKSRKVDFKNKAGDSRTNYDYEDLAGIAEAIDPILAKHGLSYRHRSKQEARMLTITCIVSHRDGHSEETTLCGPYDESGNKNAIQSVGSTATYLQRYTLKLALGLSATKDDDGGSGSDGKPRITVDQAIVINDKLKEYGFNRDSFLRWAKCENVDQILASNYNSVIRELDARKSRK